MSGRRPNGRARAVAVAASIAFHVLVLAILARFLVQVATYAEPPVVQVVLVRPQALPTRSWPARAERREAPRRTPLQLHAPVAAPPGVETLPLAPQAAPPADTLPAAARQALRGLAGCDSPRLTREEREHCDARRWARAAPADPKLNLDLTGRYAVNPEPFLSRRPTKGCRARATGDTDPMGDSGNARAGVTCVVPF